MALLWKGAGEAQGPRKLFETDKGDTAPGIVADGLSSDKGPPRAVPPFAHFSWLLRSTDGSKGWTIGPRNALGAAWSHMADDRLPILSSVMLAMKDSRGRSPYATISDGDWARLCFVDPPGNDAYPYARKFIERDWPGHVYDRFHYGPKESTDAPVRYLVTSYSLIAVGSDEFFFREHIHANHMRRHYFQLMLLAQIERAVMLALSARITHAITEYDSIRAAKERSDAETRLEVALQQVEHDFLQYVHRFRFTGVSDQVQPTELFDQLRQRMRLPQLYLDIKDELTTATNFLALRSQKRQSAGEAQSPGDESQRHGKTSPSGQLGGACGGH